MLGLVAQTVSEVGAASCQEWTIERDTWAEPGTSNSNILHTYPEDPWNLTGVASLAGRVRARLALKLKLLNPTVRAAVKCSRYRYPCQHLCYREFHDVCIQLPFQLDCMLYN